MECKYLKGNNYCSNKHNQTGECKLKIQLNIIIVIILLVVIILNNLKINNLMLWKNL